MTRENLEFLIQNARDARAEQERINAQLAAPGQRGTDPTNRARQDLAASAAERTGVADNALIAALPPGTTLEQALGYAPASPPGTASAAAPDSVNTPTPNAANGVNRYLQRVLDAHRLGDFRFNIIENPLNNLDRYTYQLGLYLVNDTDARKPDIGNLVYTNQVPTYVLAKSGVTVGFNITELEIRDSVSPSFRNRNNATTEINMTITEAYGMTLVDKMYNASQQLGVQNWRMAPLILTLEIKSLNSSGTPGPTTMVQKFYSLLISDMDSSLTSTGSTYKIRAVVQNGLGFTDQYYMLPTNLTLRVGAGGTTPNTTTVQAQGSPGNTPASTTPQNYTLDGTVGQFFSTLGRIMTEFYLNARLNRPDTATTPVLIYEFTVAQELATQKINMSAFSNRRRQGYNGAPNSQEIHVNRVGISELVDDILSSIENANFFTANQTVGTIRVPRVECIVEYVGYDNILNDYIKKFKFVIGILETVRPVPTVAHGEYFQLNPQHARARLEGMRNIIRKAYPYLYTGMNTEIINLDLTFNQLHIVPLPLHNGQTITPAEEGQSTSVQLQQAQNALTQANTEAQQLEQEQVRLTRRLIELNGLPATAGTTSLDPQTQRNLAEQALAQQDETGTLNVNARESAIRAEVVLIQGRRNVIGTRLNQIQDQIGVAESRISDLRTGSLVIYDAANVPTELRSRVNTRPEDVARARQAADAQRQAAQARGTSGRGRSRFVEDVPVRTREPGRLSYAASPADIANNLARPSNVQDDQQNAVRGIYSTILQQLYDRVGMQLTEIEMEIMGDPYWLGQSNLERINELTEYIRTGGVAAVGDNARTSLPTASGVPATFAQRAGLDSMIYADYNGKDAAFLLLFRAGNTPSDTTGYMNFESSNSESVFFNGVYIALEVTHQFVNGKFTQRIRATRDALTNLSQATQAPATAPGSPAAGTQPNNTSPPSSEPVAPASNPVASANAAQPAQPDVRTVTAQEAQAAGVTVPGGRSPPLQAPVAPVSATQNPANAPPTEPPEGAGYLSVNFG